MLYSVLGAKIMKKNYRDFSNVGNKYLPNFDGGSSAPRLPPGSYILKFDPQQGIFWFESKDIVSDDILDLPSPEYDQITKEMLYFMRPEVKELFDKGGYVYKRSALLHGLPGTGKTVITNRVARDIIKAGGICLWVTEPALLAAAFSALEDIQPNILTGVIFEEFDGIVQKHESELLTLLDGQVQKNNVIYLATTNYLNRIPKRIYRPGRMSSVIEVKYPHAEARRMYLEHKYARLGIHSVDVASRVAATKGLSIDELKEVVQAVDLLRNPLDAVLTRLKQLKSAGGQDEEEGDEEGVGVRSRGGRLTWPSQPAPRYNHIDLKSDDDGDGEL
jgi:SpoVK/Ycf46/Vps4 family AAA+-type ATPase